MRIAVIGSGAIGSLVAGYLKLKDRDVSLVGRRESVEAIQKKGLDISGVRGNFKVDIGISQSLNYTPELVILGTKTQDIKSVLEENASLMRQALVLTAQNGVQADDICAEYLPKENIVSSVVMFGATYVEPGKVTHNFEGAWVVGLPFSGKSDERLAKISSSLEGVFPVVISEDIRGMKFLKIFVNANNCIPAILGKSMQEVFSDLSVSRISIAIWKEAFEIISRAGIKLVSLPGFPVENLTRLSSMPSPEAAKVFSGMMKGLSQEPLYGSMLQSIMRGRTSEIDYINGEFLRLAKDNQAASGLNRVLVGMVHEVEKRNRFFSKEELIEATREFVN